MGQSVSREVACGPRNRVRIAAVVDEGGSGVRLTDSYGRPIEAGTANEWAPEFARQIAALLVAAADHADQILLGDSEAS